MVKFCPQCGDIVSAGVCKKCGVQSQSASESAQVEDENEIRENISNRFVSSVVVEDDVESGVARMLNLNEAGQHAVDVIQKQKQVVGQCTGCGGKVTDSEGNFMIDSALWHAACYNQTHRCGACNQPLATSNEKQKQAINALGTVFHSECWKCVECQSALETTFVAVGELPYCKTCGDKKKQEIQENRQKRAAAARQKKQVTPGKEGWQAKRGELEVLCPTCGLNIPGGVGVEVLGSLYHPECFVCGSCGQPFDDGAFVPKDGQAYHKACAQKLFGSKCFKCGQTITGPFVQIDGQKCHKACLVCDFCQGPLSGGYAPVGDKLACPSCASTVASPQPTATYTRNVTGPQGGFTVHPITGQKIMRN